MGNFRIFYRPGCSVPTIVAVYPCRPYPTSFYADDSDLIDEDPENDPKNPLEAILGPCPKPDENNRHYETWQASARLVINRLDSDAILGLLSQ